MNITKETIIGKLVAHNYPTARIFKKHTIDFCCNGDRTIGEACIQQKIDVDELLKELQSVAKKENNDSVNFSNWDLDLLADYIEKTHHRYVNTQIKELLPYLNQLTSVHGVTNPALKNINKLFNEAAEELTTHMKKEETILFPFIRKMVAAQKNNEKLNPSHFQTINNPISMMKQDHDAEGNRFREIARLSNNYQPPTNACNTYIVTYKLLEAFENDLHKHIHLENNLLFPKAISLEENLTK